MTVLSYGDSVGITLYKRKRLALVVPFSAEGERNYNEKRNGWQDKKCRSKNSTAAQTYHHFTDGTAHLRDFSAYRYIPSIEPIYPE